MPNINIELCLSLSAAQTMGPRPSTAAAAASAPPVRGVPQYKYTPNIRSPQQHMNTQPQVTMQQVRLCSTFIPSHLKVGMCNIDKIFSEILSIIRWYFAECVIVLVS